MRFIRFSVVVFVFAVTAVLHAGVVINEVAWMGTTGSTANEWIELYNNSGSSVSLTNWTLKAADNTPSVTLSGSIAAYSYYLLDGRTTTPSPASPPTRSTPER